MYQELLGVYSRLWLLLWGCLLAAAVQAGPALSSFRLEKIAEGLYVHQGRHENYTETNHGDIANTAIVIGQKCIAVLDTGGSPEGGRAFLQAIRTISKRRICYVINSHVHPDHVLGNSAFVGEKPVFVGHARLRDALQQNAEYFRERYLKANAGDVVNAIVPPSKPVSTQLELDLGGRRLTLVAYDTAHTGQDLTAYDDKTGTLWLGDLLFVDRIPALDGSIKGWLNALGQLRALKAARAIPGHGPASVAWPDSLAPEERYLGALVADIRTVIKNGGTLEQAMETVGAGERDRWQLFDEYHKRNITKAYAELEWE